MTIIKAISGKPIPKTFIAIAPSSQKREKDPGEPGSSGQ
jgi:hypothetical protein